MIKERHVQSVLVLLLFFCAPLLAQDGDAENILLRNIVLTDPTGRTPDRKVNILIRSQKLEVISEDKISRKEAQQVINANGGFIVGKLEVGEAPNFVILRTDPRVNFEAILDTRAYTSFAVHNGLVVKNDL